LAGAGAEQHLGGGDEVRRVATGLRAAMNVPDLGLKPLFIVLRAGFGNLSPADHRRLPQTFYCLGFLHALSARAKTGCNGGCLVGKKHAVLLIRLDKERRKEMQVEMAHKKSPRAKVLKLADKTSNLRALATSPAPDWSVRRKIEYIAWARKVVADLRGTNEVLEKQFDAAAQAAEQSLIPGD
jgi:hypothetical protein